MTAGILAVGSYTPERQVSNDELAQTLDTSDEWIKSHTGIGNRHIASEKETTSYMATWAARNALEKAGLSTDDMDHIIVASIPPALAEMDKKGILKRGMKILTVGFGGGLTYGGNYIEW